MCDILQLASFFCDTGLLSSLVGLSFQCQSWRTNPFYTIVIAADSRFPRSLQTMVGTLMALSNPPDLRMFQPESTSLQWCHVDPFSRQLLDSFFFVFAHPGGDLTLCFSVLLNMSLPVPRFLSLLLPFLLPCLSLPLPSSILISGGQSSVGGNSDVGAFARAVIAETALLTPAGVSTHPPSTGNDVLFFPQHPYSVGFTEPVSEPNDDFSSPPKPGPAPNNTQDTHGNTGAVSTPLMMAYYPAWVAEKLPPESINLSRFDWIDFGFAIPNNTYGLGWDGSDMAPSILTRLVTAAHGQGKNVKLSIGGWSGSK